ncbi:MAG: hypothetical protein GKR89_25620 [Candidatus Latescibacteria bacterium]|nr:hypothetical protein [Candidatus Latescibacterota bacterium]
MQRDDHGQRVRFFLDGPTTFKSLRQFSRFPAADLRAAGRSRLFAPHILEGHFASDRLEDKFIRALAARRAVDLGEILESFEFFERVRPRMRAPCIGDLCCGHALLGILFALFERKVERVVCLDRTQPPSYHKVLESAVEVAPWVGPKMEYHIGPIGPDWRSFLPPGTPLMAVHACAGLTDRCIDLALELNSRLAVMPCCHRPGLSKAPPIITQELGYRLAIDVDRTYRLTEAGYKVHWSKIPEAVTPINRILMATPPDTPAN